MNPGVMILVRTLTVLAASCGMLAAQTPRIFPGGVVNAAHYAPAGKPGHPVAPGSIAAIFGENLATATVAADSLPLPRSLAGTSVTIGGVSAPLFFVSPGQVNVEVPSSVLPTSELEHKQVPVVVAGPTGVSDPVMAEVFTVSSGIFTLDYSGCGRGLVFNVTEGWNPTLNTPENSISPGKYLVIYGTGLGPTIPLPVPDGEPAPSDPLAHAQWGTGALVGGKPSWSLYSGRAPGWVGLDQVNVQLWDDTPEGCNVPLVIGAPRSQPVLVSVRKGGGQCVDPPPSSYAVLDWSRVIFYSGLYPPPPSDTFRAKFPSGFNRRPEEPVRLLEGCQCGSRAGEGPYCPTPGDRSLNAGVLTLRSSTIGKVELTPTIEGHELVYTATLGRGSVQPGDFTVEGPGSAEVGTFSSTVRIPVAIQLLSNFPPGSSIPWNQPLTVTWAGGDPKALVGLRLVSSGSFCECWARTTAGKVTMGTISVPPYGQALPLVGSDDVEVVVRMDPDPAQVQTFSANGLTLGGRHTWSYEFRFGSLRSR